MRTKYITELNKGTIDIKPINIWQALFLSFFFDWILMFVNEPTALFYEVLYMFGVPTYNDFWYGLSTGLSVLYQYGAIIVLIIFISKRNKVQDFDIKSVELKKKDYVYSCMLIISYILLTYGWFDYILFSIPTGETFDWVMEYFNSLPLWILLIESCVIAPIFEELLYRGILLKGLSKRYNSKKAIVYSALIFGIAHLNIPQGINAFLIGLILGVVYYYTNSIYICMLMHLANNLLVNFVVYPMSNFWTIVLFIAVPIIGLAVMIMSFKKLRLKERYRERFLEY